MAYESDGNGFPSSFVITEENFAALLGITLAEKSISTSQNSGLIILQLNPKSQINQEFTLHLTNDEYFSISLLIEN